MGKETEGVVMAGFGGQGVLFLGKILAETGMMLGRQVSWMPAYGPEMRGGTANCTVVISKEPIASPIVNEPDTLIAMNVPSLDKFADKVKPDGVIIYNSSLIKDFTFRNDVKVFAVPANDLANELGEAKIANLVLAGAFARFTDMMDFDDFNKAIPRMVPANKKALLDLNMAALKKGYDYTKNMH